MTTWTGRASNRAIAWLGVGVFVALVTFTFVLWSSSPTWVIVLNAVIAVAVLIALVIASSVRVLVTDEHFGVSWGPTHWPTRSIAWKQVSAVSVVDVDPWRWGGWGYRWMPGKKGTAAVVRRGPGIKVDLVDGRFFLVTVDDADAGATAARAAMAVRG